MLFGDEIGDWLLRPDLSTPRPAHVRRLGDEPSPDELGERTFAVNRRQSRDGRAAARHEDLAALLDAVEMLAQAIMKLAYPDFVFTPM